MNKNLPIPDIFHAKGMAGIMRTGFADKIVAILNSGSGSSVASLEERLTRQAVEVVIIENPTQQDRTALKDRACVFYGPTFVDWIKPALFYPEEIALREDLSPAEIKKRTADFARKLKKTERFVLDTDPLEEQGLKEWLEIFRTHVMGKAYAVETTDETLIPSLKSKNQLKYWRAIYVRDPDSKHMVGGMLLEISPERRLLTIRRAAFDTSERLRKTPISIRAYHEATALAKKEGLSLISYGADPALFGELAGLGLQQFKSRLGFKPIPSTLIQKDRLLILLSPAAFPQGFVVFAYDDTGDLVVQVHCELPRDYTFPRGITVIRTSER